MFFNSKIALNEVYFGKTPELQKIEKQLDKFRQKYMGKYISEIHCNSDPDLLKFNRMMEDYFGFGCFSLHIINQPLVNASTVPISLRYDSINSNKNLIANKNGFKFNKDAEYAILVYMYSGVIFNPIFNTEEVMAAIMHEVGHNFYAALDKKHGILSALFAISKFINIITQIIQGIINGDTSFTKTDILLIAKISPIFFNVIMNAELKVEKYMRENKNIVAIIDDWYNTYVSMISIFKDEYRIIIGLSTLGFYGVIKNAKKLPNELLNPVNYVSLIKGIPDEKTADNFATMYGYGPALSSFLTKIEIDPNITNNRISKIKDAYLKIPIISNIYTINLSISRLINSPFDEHPNSLIRIKDQLDMLEREVMKEDLDPEMRKVILADCKACKDQMNKLIDTSNGIKDKNIVKHIYFKALYKNSNCKELKDIIYDEANKFDVYDRTYQEKLKSN